MTRTLRFDRTLAGAPDLALAGAPDLALAGGGN
jgi:hypothetical protein